MDKETLLIVEDNNILREGLRDILAFEGFNVLTASNGSDALDKMSLAIPDLIISDIAMPVMDGYTFFQAVRARTDWLKIPFVFLTARGEKADVLTGKNLGAEDYLVKPLTRDELLTAVRARLARANELQVAQLQHAYEASLTVLANAIDIRDPYTRGHVERVTAYSLALGEQLGLYGRKLDHLRIGAILHDIGKIFISESTLFKKEPLTEDEWAEIRRHPLAGAEMVKDITYLAPAAPIIRHHHESWDGSGYPDGLVGEGIPVAARIVAVADSFDAMTIHRPYRQARSLEAAYQEMLDLAGRRYDPAVVAVFQTSILGNKIQAIWQPWHARLSRPQAMMD